MPFSILDRLGSPGSLNGAQPNARSPSKRSYQLLSNRMYVSETVGRRNPAVEITASHEHVHAITFETIYKLFRFTRCPLRKKE